MFKKFKDKLAEEMKQSPARLQASVQQLAQAVVSPALSNSSIQEVSVASSDNFSLTEDGDETPKNTPAKHSVFRTVDLMSPSVSNRTDVSRRSSVSSVTSDASSLFPMYESPPNLYHLQSDMDQSASELDEISPHLDRVTKDQLYSTYRKVQAKYHKYRGRYTDLAAHYRELDKEKSKLESVLVETQDKVVRRITDLKEQCQLEQQAKAHLEEALRNDIEEKDHVISTLVTKVKLLQAGESNRTPENATSEDTRPSDVSKVNLIDLSGGEPAFADRDSRNALSEAENAQLRDKLKKLETLTLRYKESLKRNKEKFTEVTKERNILENEHEALKNSTAERISALEGELSAARVEIDNLTEQVNTLQRHEEESAISLAENKLSVHRELEEKEEQIKQLQTDLKRATEDRENSTEPAIAGHKAESNATAAVRDASLVPVATQSTVSVRQAESDETDSTILRLRESEAQLCETRCKLNELEKRCADHRNEKESLVAELAAYKTTCTELRSEYDAQKIVMEERRKNADTTIEKLQATVQSVDKELENMRNALIDRDHVCENYSKKVQQYAAMLEKAKHKLAEQETRAKSLNDKLNDSTELSKTHEEELRIKKTELTALRTELQVCGSTIDDLRNKVQADNSTISLLKKQRSDLKNRLVHYDDCARYLKQDCTDVKCIVKEQFSSQEAEMSNLRAILVASLARLEQETTNLKSEVDESRSRLNDSQLMASRETAKLRSELARMVKLVSTLEAELKSNDELNAANNKLIAEIDNLNFRIHDLEKTSYDSTHSQREMEDLRERLKRLGNLESANRALSSEMDDLREKHARAFDRVDELNAKLREATDLIDSLRSAENGERDALREQLGASTSEITRLRIDLTEREAEVASRNEELVSEKGRVAHLESTCDDHVRTIEEHVRKYLDLEAECRATKDNHAREIADLTESNKRLQETVNVKLVQLKKMKVIKERQSKTIDETNARLNELRNKHAQLSDTLETREKQVESLRSENAQLAKITLENKDLKDKHNDLLSRNERLRENEEIAKRQIGDYERNIEELRKMAGDYKASCQSGHEETERLRGELTVSNEQLKRESAESSSLKETLSIREGELRLIGEHLDEWNRQLRYDHSVTDSDRVSTVNERDDDNDNDDESLITKLKNLLKEQVARMRNVEERNAKLTVKLNDLIRRNSDLVAMRSENDELIARQTTLRNRIVELEAVDTNNGELQSRVSALEAVVRSLEAEKHESDRRVAEAEANALRIFQDTSELNALKNLLTEKEAIIEQLTGNENSNGSQEKVADLQLQIDSLARTNDTLREELEIARNGKLHEENKRLAAQLDEALITFQAKETQMQLINNELKAQANQLREQSKINEEEQGMRLKQLVKEFQAQLHDKEEELQAALEKRFDRQHNYESNLVQQYKEQLKDCQMELSEKSEQLESLVLEKRDAIAEKGKDIDHLVEQIARIKREHNDEIKELERKWKAIVQQRIDHLQIKHDEELNELTKEWQSERKLDAQTSEATSEELESTSRVAMAAIHTSTGSIHTLQQTLTSQRRELAELRKLVKLRQDTLEDSTEIEYLRNILYEYMMGRETMVLARVIAAVVKFDQEQTAKILKKEEDKLTLFGSLGLT